MTALAGSAMAAKELDAWVPDLRDALGERAPHLPTDAVLADARGHLDRLLAAMPDPGATAPQMRAFSIGGAIYIAVHLALKAQGLDASASWSVCERATHLHFERMRGVPRLLARHAMFSWPMKALSRHLASRSATEPVGGWVFEFIEGEGDVAYGVDYTRCAIRELAIAHGAADFAPFICLSDVIGSDVFGWGLQRTETLAQGGGRCDFRFRRGAPTDVKVRLPQV